MQSICISIALLLAAAGAGIAQETHLTQHAEVPSERDGVPVVRFEELGGFAYAPGGAIPPAVLALDGKQVWVRGHMLPTEMKGNAVTSFMLVGGVAGCCFGAAPSLNQLIEVTADEQAKVDYSPDDPVWVRGRLAVGEVRTGDAVVGLYRMAAEEVDDSE